MGRKIPALYDVCECNHEAMLHIDRIKTCFFEIPSGKKKFRGAFPLDWARQECGCTKFKFSVSNTANPIPTLIQGDD